MRYFLALQLCAAAGYTIRAWLDPYYSKWFTLPLSFSILFTAIAAYGFGWN